MHYKYKKLNRGKLDRGGSSYGPPGVTKLYQYAMSRMDNCPYVIDPPLNSLDSGGVVQLGNSSITVCYSCDLQDASVKQSRPVELVSRVSSSRKFSTGICSAGWTLSSLSLQPSHKKDFNQFNYCEVITKSRKNHVFEGGVV